MFNYWLWFLCDRHAVRIIHFIAKLVKKHALAVRLVELVCFFASAGSVFGIFQLPDEHFALRFLILHLLKLLLLLVALASGGSQTSFHE